MYACVLVQSTFFCSLGFSVSYIIYIISQYNIKDKFLKDDFPILPMLEMTGNLVGWLKTSVLPILQKSHKSGMSLRSMFQGVQL